MDFATIWMTMTADKRYDALRAAGGSEKTAKRMKTYSWSDLPEAAIWSFKPESFKEAMQAATQCAECRDGEHDNLTERVRLVVCTASGERPYRANLCDQHVFIREDDGYRVRIIREAVQAAQKMSLHDLHYTVRTNLLEAQKYVGLAATSSHKLDTQMTRRHILWAKAALARATKNLEVVQADVGRKPVLLRFTDDPDKRVTDDGYIVRRHHETQYIVTNPRGENVNHPFLLLSTHGNCRAAIAVDRLELAKAAREAAGESLQKE